MTTRDRLIEAAIAEGHFQFARYVMTAKMNHSDLVRRLNYYNCYHLRNLKIIKNND
jgi:hypothetical protein